MPPSRSSDVAVAEVVGDEVLIHPGTALTSVDPEQLERLQEAGRPGWLRPLGAHEGEVRLAVAGLHRSPAPVGDVYVLTRNDGASALRVEPLRRSRAATLLGATFNAYAQDHDRLISQLDVCARIAETAPLWRVDVPTGASASDVAIAVLERAGEGA